MCGVREKTDCLFKIDLGLEFIKMIKCDLSKSEQI